MLCLSFSTLHIACAIPIPAMPLQFFSGLFRCGASPRQSMPLRFFPSLNYYMPRLTIAYRHISIPLRLHACPLKAFPSHTYHCYSISDHCVANHSMAIHVCSLLCPCTALICLSKAIRFISYLLPAVPLLRIQWVAMPLLCQLRVLLVKHGCLQLDQLIPALLQLNSQRRFRLNSRHSDGFLPVFQFLPGFGELLMIFLHLGL